MNKKLAVVLLVSICGNALGATTGMERVKGAVKGIKNNKVGNLADQAFQASLRKEITAFAAEYDIPWIANLYCAAALAGWITQVGFEANSTDLLKSRDLKRLPVASAFGAVVGEVAVQGTAWAGNWCAEQTGITRPESTKSGLGGAAYRALAAAANATLRTVCQTATVAALSPNSGGTNQTSFQDSLQD